jgi:hypothetical protein
MLCSLATCRYSPVCHLQPLTSHKLPQQVLKVLVINVRANRPTQVKAEKISVCLKTATYRNIPQHTAIYRNILCCGMLRYIAVYCGVGYIAVYCGVLRYVAVFRQTQKILNCSKAETLHYSETLHEVKCAKNDKKSQSYAKIIVPVNVLMTPT